MADFGRSPDGSGYSAEPEPSSTVSAVPVSIPNAAALAFLEAAIQLMVAIEWETPAICDGVNIDHRCSILLDHAREVRESLRNNGVDPDDPERFYDQFRSDDE